MVPPVIVSSVSECIPSSPDKAVILPSLIFITPSACNVSSAQSKLKVPEVIVKFPPALSPFVLTLSSSDVVSVFSSFFSLSFFFSALLFSGISGNWPFFISGGSGLSPLSSGGAIFSPLPPSGLGPPPKPSSWVFVDFSLPSPETTVKSPPFIAKFVSAWIASSPDVILNVPPSINI